MNILLTNDDGVSAIGINILYEHLKDLGNVKILAPDSERSTTGHTMTLSSPLRINNISENIYSCSGYPADCAYLGVGHLFDNQKVDLVVSGINYGANLGQDIFYSGTAAAAREATFRGVKAFAVSLNVDFSKPPRKDHHFDRAAKFVRRLIQNKVYDNLNQHELLNINVPDSKASNKEEEFEFGSLGFRDYSSDIEHRVDCRGRDYFWISGVHKQDIGVENSDVQIIKKNKISITPMNSGGYDHDLHLKWTKIII